MNDVAFIKGNQESKNGGCCATKGGFNLGFKLGGFRVVLNRAGARAALDGLIGRQRF